MKKSYKIIFLGNTAVGKTMLIYRFVSDGTIIPEPTVGIDFFSGELTIITEENIEKKVRLQLWDTAGQERFTPIILPYIRDSFLAIIVYAINDRASFKKLKHWVELYKEKSNTKPNILIVANKSDLRTVSSNSDSKEETLKINDDEGRAYAKSINAKFCTSSALEKADIQMLVESMKETIAEDVKKNPEIEIQKINMNLNAKRKRGCC